MEERVNACPVDGIGRVWGILADFPKFLYVISPAYRASAL